MSEDTVDHDVQEAAARDRVNVERAAAKKRVYTHPLRKKYEALSEQCTAAVAAGDKPKIAELMAAKQKAHTEWWKATAADRKAAKRST